MKIIEGGVTAAKGFEAASTAAKIKYQDRTDMAMIYSQVPCECAGTFTTNVVKAACVKWGSAGCKERCESTGCDRQFRNCQCMYRCGRIWLLQGHSRCGSRSSWN